MAKYLMLIAVMALMFACGGEAPATVIAVEWSNKSIDTMSWNEAESYCDALEENGRSDWRLPNINELRSIIINCPRTMLNGECRISDPDCLGGDCDDDYCFCYSDWADSFSKIGDDKHTQLWSSSIHAAFPNTAWLVAFGSGRVAYAIKSTLASVRCVR